MIIIIILFYTWKSDVLNICSPDDDNMKLYIISLHPFFLFTSWEFFTSVLADGLSLEFEWQQISSSFHQTLIIIIIIILFYTLKSDVLNISSPEDQQHETLNCEFVSCFIIILYYAWYIWRDYIKFLYIEHRKDFMD